MDNLRNRSDYIDNLIYNFIEQNIDESNNSIISSIFGFITIYNLYYKNFLIASICYIIYYIYYKSYIYYLAKYNEKNSNALYDIIEYNAIGFIITYQLHVSYYLLINLLSFLMILNLGCQKKKYGDDNDITDNAKFICLGNPDKILNKIKNFNSGFLHLVIFFIIFSST